MMLGTSESNHLAAAVSLPPSPLALLVPLAQSDADVAASAGHALEAALPPTLLVLIAVVAAAGTFLLLPGRRPASARSVGGVLLVFAALLLGLSLLRFAVGTKGEAAGIYFWIFAVIALVGALRVITHPRPVYAALYFVLTVFATAGLFILLWAEFMAAALVLIYAGAILVTYVFVIMLAASSTPGGVAKLSDEDAVSREPFAAAAVGFALVGVLLFVIFDRAERVTPGHNRTYTFEAERARPDGEGGGVIFQDEVDAPTPSAARQRVPDGLTLRGDPQPAYSIQALGRYLFRAQGINLELAGLLLTVGMVGAILIARRRVIVPDEGPAAPAPAGSLTAPATPVTDDPFSIPVYGTDNPRQKAYPET